MARYKYLPISRDAFNLEVYFKKIVANCSWRSAMGKWSAVYLQ